MLLSSERAKFEEHLKRLDYHDRMMRFECSTTDHGIAEYVAGIDLSRDVIFGLFDDQCVLRGAAHVAFGNGIADLGLSVEPGLRKLGHGTRLLDRAIDWSRFRATRFSSQCLTQNRWMMRHLTGMGFVVERDRETAIASMDLTPADGILTYKTITEENLGWLSYGTKLFFRQIEMTSRREAA
jgi:GNAT superfamily N-acetyltransferase